MKKLHLLSQKKLIALVFFMDRHKPLSYSFRHLVWSTLISIICLSVVCDQRCLNGQDLCWTIQLLERIYIHFLTHNFIHTKTKMIHRVIAWFCDLTKWDAIFFRLTMCFHPFNLLLSSCMWLVRLINICSV